MVTGSGRYAALRNPVIYCFSFSLQVAENNCAKIAMNDHSWVDPTSLLLPTLWNLISWKRKGDYQKTGVGVRRKEEGQLCVYVCILGVEGGRWGVCKKERKGEEQCNQEVHEI